MAERAGELPVPGVYGVPEQWPHVSALYQQAGFQHDGHTEEVYLARLTDLPRVPGPLTGLEARRSVGLNGTRLSASTGPRGQPTAHPPRERMDRAVDRDR